MKNRLTKSQREERINELLDNLFWGEKMIQKKEATREELQDEITKMEKELKMLGYKG